ncbi:MAG: EamA family transporter [Gammaproteobacteria bacterium]|nr:EamA family transporter [Gammaproteobacteria bacterium]
MKPSRTSQLVIAFATVYLVWGSTYLAIRVGVAALPPALFAGVRFLLAGLVMLAFALARGAQLPRSPRDWATVAITGVLMLVGANGLVTWSEQWVESNQAALIVATSALWLAGIGALGPNGERVNARTVAGLLLGFGGVAVLVGSGLELRAGPPLAYAALISSSALWSMGSVYSRRHPVGAAPIMTAALQTLTAAAVLIPLGVLLGEPARWSWEPRALWALAYLIVFGSCIAYAAYAWLVHEVSPARLGTYAYVNPAVAVFLGWWLLGERLNPTQIAGTVIILLGVVIVTLAGGRKPR